ncbi:uncharacterized protein BP01DRAFT_193570 [Aspergillus saccharolyticus JOP 1030-1]|uniref:BHLH domain-containing protein n=1 Tax=Aspergillus saccharolyticus JOP 1030-1 TaxID=1450539 RepID=A0A318ZLN5_9EURO|nr:hypothetical protein BP01DRAFT_193570 [Aspergillus saccharolyticus JOP 1030-1]PYH47655.1 hypothetical protein BP01DRAFT_193570 [Aspergillus saccharolyticus JOP 1030-1]
MKSRPETCGEDSNIRLCSSVDFFSSSKRVRCNRTGLVFRPYPATRLEGEGLSISTTPSKALPPSRCPPGSRGSAGAPQRIIPSIRNLSRHERQNERMMKMVRRLISNASELTRMDDSLLHQILSFISCMPSPQNLLSFGITFYYSQSTITTPTLLHSTTSITPRLTQTSLGYRSPIPVTPTTHCSWLLDSCDCGLKQINSRFTVY